MQRILEVDDLYEMRPESNTDGVCAVLSSSKVSVIRIILKRLRRQKFQPYSALRVPLSKSTMPFSWPDDLSCRYLSARILFLINQ